MKIFNSDFSYLKLARSGAAKPPPPFFVFFSPRPFPPP